MRFDKEKFILRLDLLIRQWILTSDMLFKSGYSLEESMDVMSLFFTGSIQIIFELRDTDVIHSGVHQPFETFVQVISIGLNQMKEKIVMNRNSGYPIPVLICQEQLLIKEVTEALADDIEELFKQPLNYA